MWSYTPRVPQWLGWESFLRMQQSASLTDFKPILITCPTSGPAFVPLLSPIQQCMTPVCTIVQLCKAALLTLAMDPGLLWKVSLIKYYNNNLLLWINYFVYSNICTQKTKMSLLVAPFFFFVVIYSIKWVLHELYSEI